LCAISLYKSSSYFSSIANYSSFSYPGTHSYLIKPSGLSHRANHDPLTVRFSCTKGIPHEKPLSLFIIYRKNIIIKKSRPRPYIIHPPNDPSNHQIH
jgi:hypothetical protein